MKKFFIMLILFSGSFICCNKTEIVRIEIQPSEYILSDVSCLKIDEAFSVIGYDEKGHGKNLSLKDVAFKVENPDIIMLSSFGDDITYGVDFGIYDHICPLSMGRARIIGRYQDKEASAYIIVYQDVRYRYKIPLVSGPSPPIALGHDGSLYAGGDALYSFSPELILKWKYYLPGGCKIDNGISIGPDDTIHFISDIFLYAVNKNGELKWRKILSTETDNFLAIDYDGSIYVTTYDGNLYKFNSDGNLNWQITTPEKWLDSPVIGLNGNVFFTAYDEITKKSYLYSIKSDSTLNWKAEFNVSFVCNLAIDNDGSIITCGYRNGDGVVLAINSDGSLKWEINLGEGKGFFSFMYPVAPVIANNNIILLPIVNYSISIYNVDLIAIDEGSLNIIWERYGNVSEGLVTSPSVTVSENQHIYVSVINEIHELDGTGNIVKKYFSYGQNFFSNPFFLILSDNGFLYLWATGSYVESISVGGWAYLYGIKTDFPLANSPWPKYRKDNQNSGRY